MIAAIAEDRVIGKDNDMPWHLPADLKHFKQVTLGKPVVMGRKTYESIGKALPGRINIVISRSSQLSLPDAIVVNDPDGALHAAGDVDEVMVIGGGHIYDVFMPKAQRLYLTQIELQVDGDTRFPDFQTSREWQLVAEEQGITDENNIHQHRFQTWQRQP